MPVDRDVLEKLSALRTPEPTGVEQLIRSIHKAPLLREWVTLESTALAPVPVESHGRWKIVALLAVPAEPQSEPHGGGQWRCAALATPWAAVEWNWPEKTVAQTIDLRSRKDLSALRARQSILTYPPDAGAGLAPAEHAQREKALFGALDALLSRPPSNDNDLAMLARHYAGLLPEGAYPYYWVLAPASRAWLQPAAKAPRVAPHGTPERPSSIQEPAARGEQVGEPITMRCSDAPTDLSSRIGPWLRQGEAMAQSCAVPSMATELHALDARWRLPGCRLAFIGEFSRGKSTLINRLFGRQLVPVGPLPTTATLTSLVAGSEERMEISFEHGHREVRPLQPSSWTDFVGKDGMAGDQEVLAGVRLTVDSAWLRDHDLELIDTPGVSDPQARQAALVGDLLNQCDAAVLLVSAALPFSMTEAAFLEQHVIGRHVPCAMVVVSKLDTLPAEERPAALEVIHCRVAQISTAIPVLPAHGVEGIATDDEALQALRAQIEAMVARNDRRAWRSQQVAWHLSDQLGHVLSTGAAALEAARMSTAERQQALLEAQEAQRDSELAWANVLIDLDCRRLQREKTLREKIAQSAAELQEMLAYDLSRSPDPKSWWERDLPFRLRREVLALGQKSESALMTALAKDFEWLQAEVARSFAVRMARKTGEPTHPIAAIPAYRELPLSDVQRYRFLTRLGTGAAMVGSFLFAIPLGLAFSGAGLLAEPYFHKKVAEQKVRVGRELAHTVDHTIDQYCQRVSERLRQLYSHLSQETRREQLAWQADRTAAIKASTAGTDARDWQGLVQAAGDLRQEILEAFTQ